MSLMKKRVLSEKQKAAVRSNGARSRGIATPEGRERMRAANLRHGLFSQAEEPVLPALGEDRERFEMLRRGLDESWPGAEPSQVESLAAAMVRLERGDRRLDEIEIRLVNAWFGGEEKDTTSDEAALLRALTKRAVAFRDFMRIGNRLLNSWGHKADTPSTGLPGNSLKTQDGVTGIPGNQVEREARQTVSPPGPDPSPTA